MLSLIIVLAMAWGASSGSAVAMYQYQTALVNKPEGSAILPEWAETEDKGMYVWEDDGWLTYRIWYVWEDMISYADPVYPDEVLEKYYELKEAQVAETPYVSEEYLLELAYNSQTNEWP